MHVVPTPDIPSIPVHNSRGRFPIRRIWCVGRNYRAHTAEMGGDPERDLPFFFAKPADAALDASSGRRAKMPFPPGTTELHHEVELTVAIGRGGTDIPIDAALDHVYGYGVGLDLTRRDIQREAKQSGKPWAMAKGFDRSAPMGPIAPSSLFGHPRSGRIWLAVEREIRQDSDLARLIWSVEELVSKLSHLVALEAGDIIFTGTPAGVGPLSSGDHVTAGIDGLPGLDLSIL